MNFSPLFEDWTSIIGSDVPFGAKLWNTTSLHSGTNSFLFQPPNSQIKVDGLMEILSETLQTTAPSRFVCLLPKPEKLPSHFLELAIFNSSAPILTNGNLTSTPVAMSLVLAMNKESMLIDPIIWDLFKSRLIKLSGVGLLDSSKFLYRLMPSSRNVVLCSTPLALSQNTRLMFYYNHHRLSTFSTRMLLKIPVDPSLSLLGLPISFAR